MTFRSVLARLLLITPILVGLAACSASEPTPPRVAVWQGEQSGLLFMRVIAEQPLRDARLTMPDGRHILTQRLSQPESVIAGSGEGWNRPTVGVGGSTGSSGGFGTGVGISFPFGGGGGSARPVGQSTQAEFVLSPEQVAQYRTRPKEWLLELRFDNRIVSMPAPSLVP